LYQLAYIYSSCLSILILNPTLWMLSRLLAESKVLFSDWKAVLPDLFPEYLQFTILHQGPGQPALQVFGGINCQF